MLCVPYPQLGKNVNGTLARRLPRPKGLPFQATLDNKANLAEVRLLAGVDGLFNGIECRLGIFRLLIPNIKNFLSIYT